MPLISTIIPTPSSVFVLHNSSNAHTFNNTLTVGEYVTFAISISVPEGITKNISLQVNATSADPTGQFWIVGASLSLPSNMEAIHSYTTSKVGDSTIIRIPSLYNAADNVRDSGDIALVYVTGMPILPTTNGTNFTVNSQMRHSGNMTVVETPHSLDLIVVQPNLTMSQWCTPSAGDAGDDFVCTIHIKQLEPWVFFFFFCLLLLSIIDFL